MRLIAKNKTINILSAFIFLGILLLDRASKLYVLNNSVSYEVNAGVALSFFNQSQLLGFILNALGLVLVGYLLLKTKHADYFVKIVFVAVLAAGISNLVDRVFYGGVIDFISLWIIPTFNLADAIITTGMALIVIKLIYAGYLAKEVQSNKN